jgi:hypothetical protein
MTMPLVLEMWALWFWEDVHLDSLNQMRADDDGMRPVSEP